MEQQQLFINEILLEFPYGDDGHNNWRYASKISEKISNEFIKKILEEYMKIHGRTRKTIYK